MFATSNPHQPLLQTQAFGRFLRFCLATGLLATALATPPLLALGADDVSPEMTAEERTQLLELVDESRAMYLGLLASVSDAQWIWKPNPERWSVGECAEHIMRSNQALYGAAKMALGTPLNPEWQEQTKGKAQLLLQEMPNRSPGGAGGASAPQEIRPTGEFSRKQIIDGFTALYDELEKHVTETKEPLKQHTTEHPFPIFKTLNAYDWILYVPLHTIRHSRQMIEVMETEGYPG